MNQSRSFDRAAGFYDQTRLMLEPIAKYGIPAILDIVGPSAHILEVGAGTGRISIPLMERGADLIGCDLSSKMLNSSFGRKPLPRGFSGRMQRIFRSPNAHFDNVLTVHVLHLIPPWREVLREFKRVLCPAVHISMPKRGHLLATRSAISFVRTGGNWLEERGENGRHPGVQDNDELFQGASRNWRRGRGRGSCTL